MIDADLTALDVDDDELEGARVAIASGFADGDELAFEDAGGISGSYDGTTGVLTLTGTATVAAYEGALRTVEYRHDGNPSGARAIELSVSDNGPGIPPELMSDLFDPFVTTKVQGSGLGLALVAKIVGDHGGVIECDPAPRRTTFRILLPMHRADDGRGAEL